MTTHPTLARLLPKPTFFRRYRLILGTALVVFVLYFVYIGASASAIYRNGANGGWSKPAEYLFPYPAAVVNRQVIPLSRLRMEVRARQTYARANKLNDSPQAIASLAMEQIVDRTLYAQALRSRGIAVSDADVQKRLEAVYTQIGGQSKLRDFLKDTYGPEITVDQFSLWTREALDEAAVQYQILARATVRHILIAVPAQATAAQSDAAKAKAADVKTKITSPDKFAEVAKEYSEDAASRDNGGSLGTTVRGSDGPVISADFQAALFSLPINTVSDPVRSSQGWHLVLVDKREGDVNESLKEFTAELRAAAGLRIWLGN